MDHSSHETETSSQSDGHLDRELDAIVKIQRSLLPPIPSDTESVSFAVHYGPCARAGGDFYSVRKTRDHHYAMVIADVAGHGAGAAVVVAMFRAWLGAFRLGWQPLEKIATGINTLWVETTSLPVFATAAFFELNEQTGWIRSIHCGHPPALVVSADGTVRPLRHRAFLPLGIEPNLETEIVEDYLFPGDTLALYTDGITEARNTAGELFGSERLEAGLSQSAKQADLQSAANSFMQQVWQFSGARPQGDDQCLLLARMGGKS